MIAFRTIVACILLCVCGTVAEAAGDSPNAWPPMGPVPEDFDKSKEPLHYGKKVEYIPAKLREILWNGRVRKEHPRLYVSPETVSTLQESMKTHPAWPHLLKHADGGDPLASAFVFLVNGDKAYARKALTVFDDDKWAKTSDGLFRNSLIFDWCFNAIPEENFEDIVMRLAKSGIDENNVDLGAREQATYRRLRWTLFSDSNAAGHMAQGWAHVYPAIAHHWPGAEIEYMNMWHPDGSTFSDQLAKEVRSIDGSSWWWPNQGKPWFGHEKWIRARFAFPTATGIDIEDETVWGPNFNNRLYWALYSTDLEKGFLLNHYTSQHNFPGFHEVLNLRQRQYSEEAIIYGQNAAAKNPHYQWLINKFIYGAEGGPIEVYKKSPMRLIELALWWNPDVKELKPVAHGEGVPNGLPFSRLLVPGEMQTAAFRTGFNGKGDTIALFNFSEGYCEDFEGDSKAYNYGNLLLYKDEYLVTHTPGGPFIGYPWGYSGLCYFDTSTRAETGWDATVKPANVFTLFQREWIRKFPKCFYMKVHAFESRPDYDYLSVEGMPHYWPVKVSKEWTQQVVFLRSGVVVMFNRAEAADKRYQPRWILNMKGEWPQISGNKVRTIVPDHVEDYDGDEASYAGVMHQSRLHLKVLLPKQRHIRVAHGHLGDTPCTALVPGNQSRVAPRIDSQHGAKSDAIFTLMIKYRTLAGEEMLARAIKLRAAVQRRPGNVVIKVKSDRLQIIQTEANKDETFLFAHYPTIEDLAEALSERGWRAEMCARYETWMEGIGPESDRDLAQKLGISGVYGPGAVRTPYDGRGRLDPVKEKTIMRQGVMDKTNASAEVGRGFNRIGQTGHLEVRLPDVNAPQRNYFLNVLTATDFEGKSLAVPQSTLEENEETATAVIQWPGETVRVTFRKTGELAGQIKIERDGKIAAEREFTSEIDMRNQAYGSDFLTGRQKAP